MSVHKAVVRRPGHFLNVLLLSIFVLCPRGQVFIENKQYYKQNKKKTSILYTERIIYLLKVNLETLEQGVKYI